MSIGYQLKSILGISALVSFYGIASILVVFLGPYIGLSYTWEIVIIALLLLTWPFAVLINYARKRRARKQAVSQPVASESEASPVKQSAAPKRIHEELARAAEEAVQWLRNSRLGGSGSRDPLYALPWYLVSGPVASGKSSLTLSSGLDFQALPSQRRAEMRIVRPTRHCDWRITEAAVLLDTAGRYQSDGPTREEWLALNEILKKYRGNRVLDGFLVAVDAARIIESSETEIEQQAKVLRARLDETIQLARARFPVYLVFTHLDKLEGFEQFFRDGKSAREVWGATIPLDKSANAHALFDVEFDQLCESLVRHRLLQLGMPASPATQLQIFDFPLRFASIRSKVGLFTSALFRPNPFSESPLLRGFYFTATVHAKAQSSPPSEGKEERVPEAVGNGYFVDRFFRDVVLRDKDLAASFQAIQKKPPRTNGILLTLALILVLGLLAASAVSFIANRKLVAEATDAGQRMEEITKADFGKDVLKKDQTATRVEIDKLDALREQLAILDAGPPLYERFGFYSGDTIAPLLRTTYFDVIEKRFKKPVVADLERDLRNFAAGQPSATITTVSSTSTPGQTAAPSQEDILGRHYDLLKAYLMLSDRSRVEPVFLANTLSDYWKKSAPDNETKALKNLDFYTQQLVRDDAPTIKTDDRLVADVRHKLEAYPSVNRFYKRVVSEINAKTTQINLDSILQGRGLGVLVGTYTVPGSFTIDGYRNYMKSTIENAGDEITKDDWVMASAAVSTNQSQATDINELRKMYLRDYTDHWRKFLRGVSVRPFKSKDDAVEGLRALSSTNSPMERVMTEVVRNTNLSKKPEGTGILGWIKSWFPTGSDETGGTEVEREFSPLFEFVTPANPKDRPPMSQYRSELGQVLDPLQSATDSQLKKSSEAILTTKDELGLQKAELAISNQLEAFKTAAATDAATLLKLPLGNLREFLYGTGIDQIVHTWNDQVYPKARAIETGYPFTDSSVDASVTDLANYLNPVNGQFTQFFNKTLAPSFDDVQGQLKLKESGAIRVSDDFVNYVNNVRRLREALFASGGQQPEVAYDLTLQPSGDSDVVINIDGTSVEVRGKAAQSAKFIWPARSGSSGARITVMPSSGETAELPFTGPWGLFKMIDAGSKGTSSSTQLNLVWSVGNTQVRATLRAASTNNPFQRSLFRNLRAPQNLKK